MSDSRRAQSTSSAKPHFMFTINDRLVEGLYVVSDNEKRAEWAQYQYGCDLCDWWGFEGSRWRAFWKVYRHRCRRD